MRGLSLVVASGGHSSSRCAGLSLSRPLLLRSTGSRRTGSVVVVHGPSCSVACGIFPDQGSNPCPLHWQADSQPLRHQGSPVNIFEYILCSRELQEIQSSILKVYYPQGKYCLPFSGQQEGRRISQCQAASLLRDILQFHSQGTGFSEEGESVSK